MKIGVLGAGTIASWISDILNQLGSDKIELYGVASVPFETAQPFADKYGWKKVYPTFEDLMRDDDIDLVYVAVPNAFHFDLTMKALEYGRNVVVEKPFAVNYEQAQQMIAKAKEKGVFISEALWPAFLPSRQLIDDVIASGEIGEVTGGKLISYSNVMFLDRIKRLDLGGGALLDMGPYMLGRMTDHFGIDIKSVEGRFELMDTGCDAKDYYTIEYANGVKVECVSTVDSPREECEEYGEIYGTKGTIRFDSMSNPQNITILDKEGGEVRKIEAPKQIRGREVPFIGGYECEWIAFEKALSEGKKETAEAPNAQTLAISKAMTELRRQAGIVFPFE